MGKPKQRGKSAGRPPDGDEVASERVELRITPTQMRDWTALAEARGFSLKAVIVEAMDLLGESAEDRRAEGELADLGREVIALVGNRR